MSPCKLRSLSPLWCLVYPHLQDRELSHPGNQIALSLSEAQPRSRWLPSVFPICWVGLPSLLHEGNKTFLMGFLLLEQPSSWSKALPVCQMAAWGQSGGAWQPTEHLLVHPFVMTLRATEVIPGGVLERETHPSSQSPEAS